MSTSPQDILLQGIKTLGLSCNEEQADAFMTYLHELKKWNRAYSLTAIKKDHDIVIKHFLDSLLYLVALPERSDTVADVGTGAGFPGIPIKIIRPEIQLYLIEPVQKKAAFLRHMVRTLKLEHVEVINSRVEEVDNITVDTALTRALFDIGEFHHNARHIVNPGGTLILSKGPKVEEELQGLELPHELIQTKLPGLDIYRNLVVIFNN